ncbi:MAG: YciI family protein [Thermodesulfobacteriota bacterium]|nr:YciI family protein [Thermodesulfobacteriota bacterium]
MRIYIRYSKVHPGGRTFYELRKEDLQKLEGYPSVICFLWEGQSEPLFVPFSDYEDIFQSILPAADGQYKAQIYLQNYGIYYIANEGSNKERRDSRMKYVGIVEIEPEPGKILKNSQLTTKPLSYILKMYQEGKATDLGLPQYLAELTVAHMDYLMKKKEEKKVIAGGPGREFNKGIYILQTGSLDEAKAIIEQDPFYINSIYKENYSVFPWFQVI